MSNSGSVSPDQEPLEIERKFLITYPDPKSVEEDTLVHSFRFSSSGD